MADDYNPWKVFQSIVAQKKNVANQNKQFPGAKNAVDLLKETQKIKNKKDFDYAKFDPMGALEKSIIEDMEKKGDSRIPNIWDEHPETRMGMKKPWPVVDMDMALTAFKNPSDFSAFYSPIYKNRVSEGSLSHANTNYDLDPNKGHSVSAKWYQDTKAIKRDLKQKAMDEANAKKLYTVTMNLSDALDLTQKDKNYFKKDKVNGLASNKIRLMDWLENSDEIIAKEYAALPFMEKMKYNKDYYISKFLTNNEKLKPMLAPLAKAANYVAPIAKPIARVAGPLGAAYGALEYLKGSPANEGEEEALRRMRNRVYNKGYRGPLSD
tara:strand:- start:6203 stop:7171 length:969 start_codon:yes stop_codon:yes gene_type:complete